METAACRAIVEAHIKRLRWLTQTNDWTVDIVYGSLGDADPDALMKVKMLLDYRRATIRIDPSRHDDEAEIIHNLRHELIHLMLAPFDLYRDAVFQWVGGDAQAVGVESRLSRHAVETMVGNIERMLDFGTTPDLFNFTPTQSELAKART